MKKTMFIKLEKSEKLHSEYSAFIILSKYDQKVIDIIKEESIRFWNKQFGHWEIQVESAKIIADKVILADIEIEIQIIENGEVYKLN